jgi:uncharacterized protein
LLIGATTIAVALVTMFAPAFSPNRRAFLTVGLLTGIGGPPLALAYREFKASSQRRRTIATRAGAPVCYNIGDRPHY